MTDGDRLAAIERALAALRREVTDLREDVKRASSFQVGFQAVSRTLTYVCIIAAASATIYASLIRKGG